MVFLIQNTQNRDAVAMHLKLDELIRATQEANDAIIAAEDDTDEELAELKQLYARLCDEHAALKARLEETTNGARCPEGAPSSCLGRCRVLVTGSTGVIRAAR